MNWVANVALNFDEKEEKDWGVIFVMHQYVDYTCDHECDIPKLLRLCRAFNEGGTYDEVYKNEKYWSSQYFVDTKKEYFKLPVKARIVQAGFFLVCEQVLCN